MANKYFVNPFGEAGDLATIPDTVQSDGTVSYAQGWGPFYALQLGVNPSALPIPRPQSNQVLYDVTGAIQFLQQYGTPAWITAMENLGTSFPYPIYARVYYDPGTGPQVWENQVAGNTATPGADSTWVQISGASSGLPIGAVIDFASPVPPQGFLNCDGSAVSRTTYSNLFGAVNFLSSGTLTNGTNSITGLSIPTSSMFVGQHVEGANIPSGSTITALTSGNSITISNNVTASGTQNIQFFPWGNGDGSTTFNIPDLRRRNTVGAGGSASSPAFQGTATGQYGGEETHVMTSGELVTHSHSASLSPAITYHAGSTTGTGDTPVFNDGSGSGISVNIGNAGSSTAFNEMPLGAIMTKCIKYI